MRRIMLLVSLAVLAGGLFWASRGVGWESLARNQAVLLDWVAAHPFLAAASYVAFYVVTAALSLPHAALLTVAGGLMFGAVAGTVLTAVGATLGASVLLVVMRATLKGLLDRQRYRIPDKMRSRLERDGFSYLLAIRFLPLFPFWLVNLACVVAGVRLAVFLPATLFGVIPVTFILSSIGAGVGDVLAAGHTPDLSVVFSPRILAALFGLAVMSLLPVVLKRRWRAHA